jgi:pyruvate,orthophosphate dikinase
MDKKYVYFFGGKEIDGNAEMKDLLGGKGANLAEMCNLEIPVPPGFTITTEVCTVFYENNKKYPQGLKGQVKDAIKKVEKIMGAELGDPENPLLLSVRSGARKSMPGMMETVLNIGLNTETREGLMKKTNNPRFVYDAHRRLIQMYSDVVMEKAAGIEPEEGMGIRQQLEEKLEKMKESKGIKFDNELTAEDLKELIEIYKMKVEEVLGKPFPSDPWKQLWGGIDAVFASWNGKRACAYRKIEGIPDDWGTAVNIQVMVFGNMGNASATGVAFTRNPATGETIFYGEWLPNAQGEDVVAGIRTPNPINVAGKTEHNKHLPSLEEAMPEIYKELYAIQKSLERHYKDMLDIEFTIQEGKLWMLQCRVGKRNGPAALKMAVNMTKENLISKEEAVLRVILVREETNPEDVKGMRAALAVLTAKGGMTSHAALVARGWGKCCIVGAGEIIVDYKKKEFRVKDEVIKEGDIITLNGNKGYIYKGLLPLIKTGEENRDFVTFLKFCDSIRHLKVRTNADTPEDAARALDFGAEGIGLFRTEHMFYGKHSEKPLFKLLKMIISQTLEERKNALNELFPDMKNDIKKTMARMNGFPVTIRLLDPPLHEFIPKSPVEQKKLIESLGIEEEEFTKRTEALHENNPMMGHRGVRLGITYPEITETQARAIFEAAAELLKEGMDVLPEIMIPLASIYNEIENQFEIIKQVYNEVIKKYNLKEIPHMVGTMIETPRAALIAGRIAEKAEFFSFGTNDLTQMGFGFSRDDIGGFIPEYLKKKILPADPFQTLDIEGIGELIEIGIKRGRKTRPNLKVGICGEHGGDAASVEFCHRVGMDYVSCSPFRVPIARLVAAQAALKYKNRDL